MSQSIKSLMLTSIIMAVDNCFKTIQKQIWGKSIFFVVTLEIGTYKSGFNGKKRKFVQRP